MPPKGWRMGIPPPGYVFHEKKNAERFRGLNHDGNVPLANAPKSVRERYSGSMSHSPPKKSSRREDSTPSRARRKSSVLVEGKDEHEEAILGRAKSPTRERDEPQQDEGGDSEEEDPVWVGFREDFYEIVEQLPLELQRSFALIKELEDQVDSNTSELSSLVRAYSNYRIGQHPRVPPPPPSPSSATSPSSYHTAVENGGNAVAGPSGYNGAMDVDDEEAVAAAVEPEPSRELSPPPSASAPHSSARLARSSAAAALASRSPIPVNGSGDVDPLDLLFSRGPLSGRGRPRTRSPSTSVVLATPSPRSHSHSQSSLDHTNSLRDPLSLSEESHIDEPIASAPSNEVSLDLPVASTSDSLPTLNLPFEPKPSTTVSSKPRLSSSTPAPPPTTPPSQLCRIATLLSALIKAGEEKAAVAKGTYDRVDRQIRSLDSALDIHTNSITTEGLAALAAQAAALAPPKPPKPAKPAVVIEEPVVASGAGQKAGPSAPAVRSAQLNDEEEDVEEEIRAPRRAAPLAVPSSSHKKRRRSPVDESQFKTDSEAEEEAYEDDGDEEDDWAGEEDAPSRPARQERRTKAGRSRLKRRSTGGGNGGNGKARSRKGRKSRAPTEAKPEEVAVEEGVFTEKALEGLTIDPSEPRFCYCNNVSYGEMIGCDNDECPMEWFHLRCVGMSTPIKGKWFCRACEHLSED